ncbi:MAG: DNA replication protein [Rhodospirillaceae bacterium]|nr:DNA replication protein [Rhodospirillaceae bacterium]
MQARQLPLDLGRWPSFAPEDFLVTESNREASAWVDRWPDWPGPAIVIHGPRGAGKSHLLAVWCRRAQASGIDGTALGQGEAGDPGRWLGDREARIGIDDADRVVGNPDGERALLHLYNAVAERRGTMLLTAGRPPAHWRLDLADLASRLRAAPAVALTAPDDTLLAVVLAKLFADRQLRVPGDVIGYVAGRIERSFPAAERAVDEIDALSLRLRRSITLALVSRHWRPGDRGDPAIG